MSPEDYQTILYEVGDPTVRYVDHFELAESNCINRRMPRGAAELKVRKTGTLARGSLGAVSGLCPAATDVFHHLSSTRRALTGSPRGLMFEGHLDCEKVVIAKLMGTARP
jgi:hypothetical protein